MEWMKTYVERRQALSPDIPQCNAREFLGPDKIARLACVDYAHLQFENHVCITYVGMLSQFGQWDGPRKCLYDLENCESFFRPVEQKCQQIISNWMSDHKEKMVPLRHNTMFLKGLHDSLSIVTLNSEAEMQCHEKLRETIEQTIGFGDDILKLMKNTSDSATIF